MGTHSVSIGRTVIAVSLCLLAISFLLSGSGSSSASAVIDKHQQEILEALKPSAPDDKPRKADNHYGIKIGNVLVPETVAIPAGFFNMGQPNKNFDCYECSKDEQPVHRVEISAFEIGRFEITNAQYHAFSVATDRENAEWRQYFTPGKEDYPAMNISWNDAQEYCAWLQAVTGREYRLPTEAEWEYAARATTNNKFILGDGLSHRAANFNNKKKGVVSVVVSVLVSVLTEL